MKYIISNLKAFSLVEILLSVAMVSIFVVIFSASIIDAQSLSLSTEKRNKALRIATGSLEATRNIRDSSYANLTDGDHGLSGLSGVWSLLPASDLVYGEFRRTITISPYNLNTKQVTVNVTWNQEAGRIGRVTLTTFLTNLE